MTMWYGTIINLFIIYQEHFPAKIINKISKLNLQDKNKLKTNLSASYVGTQNCEKKIKLYAQKHLYFPASLFYPIRVFKSFDFKIIY
jgi:hypothetical protein